MKFQIDSRLTLISFFLQGGLAYAAPAVPVGTELARINNTVITLEEFNKKFAENQRFLQFKASKKMLLDNIIKRELAIQEAKRIGLDKDPEVTDRINTVLYNALLEKKLSKDFESIHISEDEAKTYYEKYPEIRTSHIFVALPPSAKADDQKKAYDKIKRIYDENFAKGQASAVSFAEVAQRTSEAPNAIRGGDLEYQTRDHLDPTYYDAAIKLGSPGKVSNIVRSQIGYHIIKLTGVHTWDETDKAAIKRIVFEEHRSKIFEKYMSSLRVQSADAVRVKSELISD